MAEKSVIISDFKNAQLKFPKLKLFWEDETFSCSGEVDVFDQNNVYWDSFLIKISIGIKSYPHFFPVLFLKDERIPKEEDRHINPDLSCCVEIEQKQFLRKKRGITILQFLDEYVIPHFADQLYFEKESKWASGDYKHGFDGKIQYYTETMGVSTLIEVLSILKNLQRIDTLKMYETCFCNSGKKLKFCHKQELKQLLQLPKNKLNTDIEIIEKILNLTSRTALEIKDS